MSLHKLTAGSGYTYLTRQVAALDATDKGGVGLASYYTARGEAPGSWIGSGLAGIDGLAAGDVVTAKQMQNLFGSGHHPLTDEREVALQQVRTMRLKARAVQRATDGDTGGASAKDDPVTAAEWQEARRLGTPFRVYDDDFSPFRIEVAKRIEAVNEAAGLPRDWPIPAPDRARVRTEVAREFFHTEHGRDAADARELAATIAKHTRPRTTAVAGFDLTFSPVKSVSTLWAVADRDVAARIEKAHHTAVRDALDFIETHALYTRTGSNGVRQVDVTGLVATSFTHRDSRAGDPDLHTHVAVANKVQTRNTGGGGGPGRWLAIDGRVLYKAAVAASETYNTALEKHLGDDLGLQFEARSDSLRAGEKKRAVREIIGVDPGLNTRWSSRRVSIEARRNYLAAAFQATHGRPPSPVEALHLAQQATLETREGKHEPRSLEEQRRTWRDQAIEYFSHAGNADGTHGLSAMLQTVLAPTARRGRSVPDAAWCTAAVGRIVGELESRRATWQVWHVRAEAQRQVRACGIDALAPEQVERLVDHLVDEVLTGRSVSLARPADQDPRTQDPITEPAALRRADGASVYDVAGAAQFTATSVLAAEQRIAAAAGRDDGRAIDQTYVDLALLETHADGVTLNAGQTAMVTAMATSGARVQLAVAPAGSGKTTAMRALANAWTQAGGTVIGLAPSAAAATQLGDAINSSHGTANGSSARADTLAKLTHAITASTTQGVPGWIASIGPDTLFVIDEAGMADTISLDHAISFALERGASVRLVGDDQQLAAIGAGGVLRDIATTHGALHLSELMRFADPAEGSASLALRDGDPTAVGYYLDHDRVHVGDLATMTDAVFDAWRTDRDDDLDALMLAPTRDLVSQLNQRAQAHRIANTPGTNPEAGACGESRISDGNTAYVGDVVITRTNDRRLRTAATDWVKNGDRWTIRHVHDPADDNPSRGGSRGASRDLTVQHQKTGRTVRLPAAYVAASVELGYASTIHTAQGISADTTHGLAHDTLSRQLLYTMLTRGRAANHLYLPVVGDGDPHSVIRPEVVLPETATDLLERVLARDDSPTSATTLQRLQTDPATLLGDAAARYVDALQVAAETTVGTETLDRITHVAEQISAGVTEAPAWPALRGHLTLLAVAGEDVDALLQAAADQADLATAHDVAAVLDWRLDDTGLRSAGDGPLPWIPAVPERLRSNPTYGSYLDARAHLVADLARQVRNDAVSGKGDTAPLWSQHGLSPDADLRADIAVWRAATQVDLADRRPTGRPAMLKAAARYQRRLDVRVRGDRTPAWLEWGDLLSSIAAAVRADAFAPELAERLAAISRAGVNAHALVRHATAPSGPLGALPDDHAAAALWWRISRHLSPAVATQANTPDPIVPTTSWQPDLERILGTERANDIASSASWPALVTAIDHAAQRGWQIDTLLGATPPPIDDVDDCQALVWHVSLVLDPVPDDNRYDQPADPLGPELRPDDLDEGYIPTRHPYDDQFVNDPASREQTVDPSAPSSELDLDFDEISHQLRQLALEREANARYPLEPTNAQIVRGFDRAAELANSPVPEARMLEVNAMAHEFFESRLPGSWGQQHLHERFHIDLAGHPLFRPGQAPAGWTVLADHLRAHGVTDKELITTGLATTTRTGRLIDRFRDRLILPITAPGHGGSETRVLGFVGRRHPDLTDHDPTTGERDIKAGPKYLNTADTPLFHKGAQLYAGYYGHGSQAGVGELLDGGAIPVVVEGPMDAAAVTLSTFGTYVGLAPLGTSLTDDQATQIAALVRDHGTSPVIATDPDIAGQVAAERSFWMLAPHYVALSTARLPSGMDPAAVLAAHGPAELAVALASAQATADMMLSARLEHAALHQAGETHDPLDATLNDITRLIAAGPPSTWPTAIERATTLAAASTGQVNAKTLEEALRWSNQPQQQAASATSRIHLTRLRIEQTAALEPDVRWRPLATSVAPQLPADRDWTEIAQHIETLARQNDDVVAILRHAAAQDDGSPRPAQGILKLLDTYITPRPADENSATSAHRRVRRDEAVTRSEPAQDHHRR